jgi:hypothetical protein
MTKNERIKILIQEGIKASGLKKHVIAGSAGTSPSQLSHFLGGRSDLPSSKFLNLLVAIDINIFEILEKKFNKNKMSKLEIDHIVKQCETLSNSDLNNLSLFIDNFSNCNKSLFSRDLK